MIRITTISIIFYFSTAWANDKIFKYYPDQAPVVIDEIYLNFKSIGFGLESGDTLFLKLEEQEGYQTQAVWDHGENDDKRSWLKNILKWSNPKRKIMIQGRSARKFHNPFIMPDAPGLIAVVLKPDKTISEIDRLLFTKVRVNCTKSTSIQLFVSNNRELWKNLGYRIIFSDYEQLDLGDSHMFISQPSVDTVWNNVAIKIPDIAYLDDEYQLRIEIPENDATWGDIANDKTRITVNGRIVNDIKLKKPEASKLLVTSKRPISYAQSIELYELPIINNAGNNQVSLELYAEITDSLSNLQREWVPVPQVGKTKLYWKNCTIEVKGESDILYYSYNFVSDFPPVQLIGDGFESLIEGEKLTIELGPGEIEWSGESQPKGRNFNFNFSDDNKSLICTRDSAEWVSGLGGEPVTIQGLKIDINESFSGRVIMNWHSPIFDHGSKKQINQSLVIGHPRMYLENNNHIFSHEKNPTLNTLILKEDDFVSTLKTGDVIIYELNNKKLKFNKTEIDKIDFDSEFLYPVIGGLSNQIRFEIRKPLAPAQKIVIKNIHLMAIDSDNVGKTVRGAFFIESSRLPLTNERIKPIDDPAMIHISRVDVSLVSSKEFIEDKNKSGTVGELPVFKIYNHGNSIIFRDKPIKLYLNMSTNDTIPTYSFLADGVKIRAPNYGDEGTGRQRYLDKLIKPKTQYHIIQRKEYLEIILNEGIQPHDTLFIEGLKIKMNKHFSDVPLSLFFADGNKSVIWRTQEVLTYSFPFFQSSEVQVVYPSSQPDFFSFYLDVRHIPHTVEKMENITLILPNHIPLEWSSDISATFKGPGREYFKTAPIVSAGGKHLIFNRNFNKKVDIDSLYVSFSGIKHKDFYYGSSTPRKFKVQFSLDGGKTICAIDPHTKWVVSDQNIALRNKNKIIKDYYAFKKGKINSIPKSIALEIRQKGRSSHSHWDPVRTKIVADDATSKRELESFNYKKPRYNKNNTRISFEILKDIDDREEYFNFGDSMAFRGLFLENADQTVENICLVVSTPFGEKKYFKSSGLVEFDKEIIGKDNEVKVTIKLKKYQDRFLGTDELFSWYRFPENYLKQLLEGSPSHQVRDLEYVKRKLAKHYNKYPKQVQFDYIFWFYLSWLKYRANVLLEHELSGLHSDISNTNFSDDYSKSLDLGYFGTKKPGEDYNFEEARKRDFDTAYELYKNGDYFGAEKLIIGSRKKDGMDDYDYIDAAYLALLGLISNELGDATLFTSISWKGSTKKTFPKHIFSIAAKKMTPSNKIRLEKWNPSIVASIEEAKAKDFEIPDTSKQYSIKHQELDPETLSEYASTKDYNIKINWVPQHLPQRFDWTYDLESPKTRIENNITLIVVGDPDDIKLNFNDVVTVHGGGKYKLVFSPWRHLARYIMISAIVGVAVNEYWL